MKTTADFTREELHRQRAGVRPERPASTANDSEPRAACAGRSELFFPIERASGGRSRWDAERVAQAQALCDSCPVRAECRARGEAEPGGFGIWGGVNSRTGKQPRAVTDEERERSQRERSRRSGQSRTDRGRALKEQDPEAYAAFRASETARRKAWKDRKNGAA